MLWEQPTSNNNNLKLTLGTRGFFLALFGYGHERRSREKFARVTIETWPTPETAQEKPLAPRVLETLPCIITLFNLTWTLRSTTRQLFFLLGFVCNVADREQRSLLSFTSSLMEYNFLMNVISQNSRFRVHFVPPPFTSYLILLHIIWLICMRLMCVCVWTIKQNKGAHLTISFILCWRFLAEKQTGKSFKLQIKREQATSPNF